MIYQYNPSLAWWGEYARQAAPGVLACFGLAAAFTVGVWAGVELWARLTRQNVV